MYNQDVKDWVEVRNAKVNVTMKYVVTPGRYSGPPEDCWPDEVEFSELVVDSVEIGDWHLEEGHDIFDWFVEEFLSEICAEAGI